MSKKAMIIIIIVLVLIIGGGLTYFLLSNKKSDTNTDNTQSKTTQSTKKLEGNALIQSVLDKLKTQVPTIANTRVFTESTDANNMLGKQGSYQYAGSFYDTRTKYQPTVVSDGSTEIEKANYGVDAGGTIELFSNSVDAKKRYDYIVAINGSIGAPEGDRLNDNAVLRVSSEYTATQQKEMLDLMEKDLNESR